MKPHFWLVLRLVGVTLAAFRPRDSKLKCEPSLTTVSGTLASAITGPLCSGDLLFEDNFDTLDYETWQHEITLAGGGNWEFQWYTNNRSNSYAEQGVLHIRPTLSANDFGESFLTSGTLNLHGGAPADQCTNPQFWGCERSGNPMNVLNPIKSARIRTVNSFAFKFGKVEVNAKMPSGDWLWPSVWFLPKHNAYGSWPASGEIDLLESRGNRDLMQGGVHVGVEQMTSSLQYGPYPQQNAWKTTHFARNTAQGNGFNKDFHRYQMEWTPDRITFSIDDVETGTINVGEGFWQYGNFDAKAPGTENPWRLGSIMAPFDQEFYCIINLAVGGTGYFPDDAVNPGGKPWLNSSPRAATDFWNGRNQWLPTWKLDSNYTKDASLQVDYLRIWAL
ncbi:beta-1,3-glucan-binding protein-like [Phlebotomus argentipes]|uniref:beta-1,3-glucan-binding protein-like n=1 Tax=Phlebotomus argentipes TaxID=94469 RepID=UPI00289333AA|nr:beta-1,3-glucan-binding protein-like [Phlebotomus argentipes]